MNKISKYEIFHKPIIPEIPLNTIPSEWDESLSQYPFLQKLKNSENNQEKKWVSECLKDI